MLKSGFLRFLFVACLTFTLGFSAFADTIRLKDGSIIKGKIVNFNGGKFTVVIGGDARQRQLSFNADEVDSIVFDTDSASAADNRIPDSANKNVGSDTNSKVITVGQSNTNNNSTTPPVSPGGNPEQTVKTSTASTSQPKPITLNVKVLADNTSNGWTNSGFVVRQGQKIKITGSGRVSLGGSHYSTPIGIASLSDAGKLKKDEPTGGLIAVIGDDNNDFIFVGESNEFVAARDGALFLGVNEGNLDDNSGAYDVRIEIFP